MKKQYIWLGVAALFAVVGFAAPVSPQAATIGFCDAPTVLPRNTPLASYSPAVCFTYSNLGTGLYTLKAYLLETAQHFCASGQWCGDTSSPKGVFQINNLSGANSTGTMTIVRTMDVYDYANFEWKIDLLNQAGVTVASATQPAGSTSNRAPSLNPIGNKTSNACQPLQFIVSASDPESNAFALTGQNLPPGATFEPATGQFSWSCPVKGQYTSILFKVTQSGPEPLSDAESISIHVYDASTSVYLPVITKSCAPGDVLCALTAYRYWITFSPPRPFNPNVSAYPTEEQLRSALQQLYGEGWRGLVTYSLDGTLSQVPRIAKEEGFQYVIAGLFWFDDAQLARERAAALQEASWIDAYVVGNEGLLFNRYEFPELKQEIESLRTATKRPVTTSEIPALYTPALLDVGDWVFPNIHPWNEGIRVITDAVQYVQAQYQGLQAQTSKPVVIREVWWPTGGGDPAATEANQAEFFRQLAGTNVKFIWGEAYDQYWKREAQPPNPDPGPHWGFHTEYGVPKQIIVELQDLYR